jgi:5-methyltetrahydropteroyltriglutamate--homocysteine methyltransferase
MKRSTDRFLTTHTGSLPRPDDLIQMMFAKESGVPVDSQALQARIRQAVAEVVALQTKAGVDLVNDGEMSKPSYATYIKDRLGGFGGTGNSFVYQDLADFPVLERKVFGDPGRSRRKTPACNAPITLEDAQAAHTDADNLCAAFAQVPHETAAQEMFMSAASPGVVSLFFRNDHYKDHETYLYAIAEVMRHEYESVAKAGIVLQIDCPDLAMGRHIQYADLPLPEFRKRAQMHVEALNHALANIPAEQLRMHVCWGNYEGPHHCDVDFSSIIDIVFKAKPHAISFEAANPRHAHEWTVWREARIPDDLVLIPGCIDSTTNFVEHPELVAERLERYAQTVGADRVVAGTDCGFSTFAGFGVIDPDICWTKLRSLKQGAAIASARLRSGR